MSDIEMNPEFEDIEEDSDVPSDVDWSDNDDPDDGPKYTNPRGTIVWPESEAKDIPILGDNDMKSGESLGGLQVHVLSKSRRYDNTWKERYRIFKNTKMIKLRIAIRSDPYMSNESDILVTQGEPSYISVWCPHYARDQPPDAVLEQHTWSCILSFYPNLVRYEMDLLDGAERAIPHRQSTISHYGFIFEDTFQKAGLRIPSGSNFPTSLVSANGIAVADPKAFTWKPAEDRPWWMNASEIKNAMGFMRMTAYFNMMPQNEKDPSMTSPNTGNYAFHVLIIIPNSATTLRNKFASSLRNGGYLQRDGKRYCFNGYFVGMLNTNFLEECSVHVQIPVIVPREIFQLNEAGGSSGMFGSANTSPSKPKVPQTPTKNGEPSSSNGIPASPSPADNKNAKMKAQMKKRLQASAPSKRNTQSSSALSAQNTADENQGGPSDTPLGVNAGSGSSNEVPELATAGFDGIETAQVAESTAVAPPAEEDHTPPATAKDKGKGKAVADDERLGDAVGANSTQGGRKKGRRN